MNDKYILVAGLSPTIQKTLSFPQDWKKSEVNRTVDALISASGKGANTARILAQNNNPVRLISQTGGRLEKFFINEMEREDVKVCFCTGPTEIRYCTTLLSENPFSMTELVEEGEPVPPETEKKVREEFNKQLDRASLLVVAGSSSPGFSPFLYKDFIELAGQRSLPVVIDRHGPLLGELLETAPLVVKINMYEFLLSYDDPDNAVQDIRSDQYGHIAGLGRKLNEKHGHRFVLTNGERETMVIDGQGDRLIKPAKAVPVNPIGCGDAVTAGVAAGLNHGMTLFDAAKLGMEWAVLNLGRKEPGTIR